MALLFAIQNLSKQFDGKTALDGINLDIEEGEIICLLGPSGCGKTTLLRIIAGLETADRGQIVFGDGQDIGLVPPHLRNFGFMFQDYALFPHKDVFDNVAFGLKMKGVSKTEIVARVYEILEAVGLNGFAKRRVTNLSGGEAQRVALARSLATRPRLLMLDEPLGSLDRALRERLMAELLVILKEVGVTTIYVTHDQAEAFAIASRVVVINKGRVEQSGQPEEIYNNPSTAFTANFLGLCNLSRGQVIKSGLVSSKWGNLTATTADYQPGKSVTILIRPEAATLDKKGNGLQGIITTRSFRGRHYQVQIQPKIGTSFTFELTADKIKKFAVGDTVTISLNPAGVVLLPVNETHQNKLLSLHEEQQLKT